MKKILSLLAITAMVGCVSCNNNKDEKTAGESTGAEKKDNSAAEKNQAAFNVVLKAFETFDVSEIDNVVASDFVDHSQVKDRNRDSLKAEILAMKSDVKDAKTEVVKSLADDDYVFCWVKFTGTSGGKTMPAGPYSMSAIEVAKFKDGKAVEHWAFMDSKEMMAMMQPMPKMMEEKKNK